MTDRFDRAQELEQLHRDASLAAARNAMPAFPSSGTCVTCREPISPARLKALPNATRCIDCARAIDVFHSHFSRGHL